MSTKFLYSLLFLMCLIAKNSFAQSQTRAGFLPTVNYNHKIANDWEINFRFESRHFVFDDNASQDQNVKYNYSLSDFSGLVGRKVGLNSKIVMGALARMAPDAVSYRTIQQFIFQGKIATLRVAHRVSTDQTFSSIEPTQFRLRYRLSAEIPFSGLKVDVKEFYFKFNTEVLNRIQDNAYGLEFRIVPNIGYVINDHHKIELGIDNRFDSFLDKQSRLNSWITITWFL